MPSQSTADIFTSLKKLHDLELHDDVIHIVSIMSKHYSKHSSYSITSTISKRKWASTNDAHTPALQSSLLESVIERDSLLFNVSQRCQMYVYWADSLYEVDQPKRAELLYYKALQIKKQVCLRTN